MKKTSFAVTFILILISSAFSEGKTYLDDFNLDLRAGYVANYWYPNGLGPFEVDAYGGNLVYSELAINHPLLFINEAFDVFQVPRIRVETNYGYSEESGFWLTTLPETLTKHPYLKTSSLFTIFEFLSVEYNREKFQARLNDPALWLSNSDTTQFIYATNVENTINELKVGLVGGGREPWENFKIGFGYAYMKMDWPFSCYSNNSYRDHYIIEKSLTYNSGYISFIADPNYAGWPLFWQMTITLGDLTGVELRMKYEKNVFKKIRSGLDLNFSWKKIAYSDTFEQEYAATEGVIIERMNNDVRMKLTLYAAYRLFGSH